MVGAKIHVLTRGGSFDLRARVATVAESEAQD
jgi:hypothetical protein